MAVLNRNKGEVKFEFKWRNEVVKDELTHRTITFNEQKFDWQDLWNKSNKGHTKKFLKTKIAGHDTLMFRLTPAKN